LHADAADADGIGDGRRNAGTPSPRSSRKHDAFLLEDDAYGYLLSPSLPPVSRSIPSAASIL